MAGWRQELKFDPVSMYFVQIMQLSICLGGKRLLFLLQTIHSERFGPMMYKKLRLVEWSRGGEVVGLEPWLTRRGVLRPVHPEVMAADASPRALLASVHQEALMFPGGSSLPWGKESLMWFFPSFQVLEFELTPEDVKAIDGLNRNFRFFKLLL